MQFRAILLACTVLALTACDQTSARYSSDYATQLSRNEVLIVPPHAEANTVDVGSGQTRMYEYEEHVEPILATQLQDSLTTKGYRIRVMMKHDLINNKTYQEYDAFREAFDAAYKEAYKKGAIVKREVAGNSTITLGGRARALGEKLAMPVFAYVEYNESVRTSGGQALDMAAGVAMSMLTGVNTSAPPDKAVIVVALIDAVNDKVLWVNSGASAGGGVASKMIYTDEEQSLNHVKTSLKMALMELPDRDKLFDKK